MPCRNQSPANRRHDRHRQPRPLGDRRRRRPQHRQRYFPRDDARRQPGRLQHPVGGPDVSPAHFVLTVFAGRLRIRDLRTRFPTRVNGRAVTAWTLADGDEIAVGPFGARLETSLPAVADDPENQLDARFGPRRLPPTKRAFVKKRPPRTGTQRAGGRPRGGGRGTGLNWLGSAPNSMTNKGVAGQNSVTNRRVPVRSRRLHSVPRPASLSRPAPNWPLSVRRWTPIAELRSRACDIRSQPSESRGRARGTSVGRGRAGRARTRVAGAGKRIGANRTSLQSERSALAADRSASRL